MTGGAIIRHLTHDDPGTTARLCELGVRVIAEGHDRAVFGNNPVFAGLAKLAGDGFLYAVYRGETPLGFFWLDRFESKRCARIHFCTFRASGKDVIRVPREILAWLVPEHFDTLTAWTPAENRLAVKFLKKMGFELLGRVKLGPDKTAVIAAFPPQN